ncbi:2-oxoglutarate dehydrogenase complex dihydrolipoyllysine-residue succinyltransferase [Hymenobacter taeanensis]|uniref:Dihydrolipoyllysine-residue succinyltransferase component of 2-oxoglutarate dehydrogenase complex n=1 Tax=Hymenobacter taeanensis TaxID=2735321 RepID=A0A6M6BDV4_9BACT|nr:MULTISPECIES: 2-oxoglutarate dehydrogenase complex dihydrolipoyllysine-residue succinyltransferase [Hymenobacter]QJX46426.1 2-oxoglutarate dehydrogenase complex dihydrolipoyllysine-residue succinyltransferase [Hymenobacter taeanensis]UOQ80287.1 2-oxoglutarate dehydrogenase complex dihydrolipoyllysine-residue succinyltransferase [Hymenobacter sp. 5414T-23]
MGLEIKIPAVGESITEVTIAKWLKADGDTVKRDEIIAELESDKATFELPAEADGVLKILVAEGETIGIGTAIADISGDGAASGSAAPAASAPAAASVTAPAADPISQGEENPQASNQSGYGGSQAGSADTPTAASPAAAPAAGGAASGGGVTVEMKIPAVGESITEVTVAKWLKEDGAQVQRDEIIAELESDKATFELPAEGSGTLRHAAKEGETIGIGATIARIEGGSGASAPAATPAAAPAASQAAPAAAAAPASSSTSYATGTPSPAAGKILGEKGINPADVQGSGRDGRITKEDAQNAQARPAAPAPAAAPASAPAKAAPAQAAPAASGNRNVRRERMSNLRKTVARRLVSVKNETAMLTTFNEVNMQPIMDLRNKFKDKFKEKHSVGLGFMSFFTKAVCVALKEWPAVNAQIDGTDIVYNDFCDISIAVSAPKGLVVPVIRNAEELSFDGIEKEIQRLAGLARDNKLTIEQMTGGTFTITNGGVFGSMMSTPIINAPQSAILGMHNIVQRPIAENGQVVIRPMMYLALSYDHRIIDGRESVSFLVRVKELLEDPTRLLLGV